MPKNIMCFFLLGGIVQIFRLHQEEIKSRRIVEMASIIVTDESDVTVQKDRWNLFVPLAYPIATEAQVLNWLEEYLACQDCSNG